MCSRDQIVFLLPLLSSLLFFSFGMGFCAQITDISGQAEQLTGVVFPDRIATGAYDVDVHGVTGCTYPQYMKQYYPILPFFIPFRWFVGRRGNCLSCPLPCHCFGCSSLFCGVLSLSVSLLLRFVIDFCGFDCGCWFACL